MMKTAYAITHTACMLTHMYVTTEAVAPCYTVQECDARDDEQHYLCPVHHKKRS